MGGRHRACALPEVVMTEQPAVPDETVITNQREVVDAIVQAFVDGDPKTSQHIVDTLGERKKGRR
jgi:hypothetical protein